MSIEKDSRRCDYVENLTVILEDSEKNKETIDALMKENTHEELLDKFKSAVSDINSGQVEFFVTDKVKNLAAVTVALLLFNGGGNGLDEIEEGLNEIQKVHKSAFDRKDCKMRVEDFKNAISILEKGLPLKLQLMLFACVMSDSFEEYWQCGESVGNILGQRIFVVQIMCLFMAIILMKAKEEPRRQVPFEAVMFVVLGLYYMPDVSRFESITRDHAKDTIEKSYNHSRALFLNDSTKDKVFAMIKGDNTKIMQLQEVCKRALKLMLSERINGVEKLDAYKAFSRDAEEYLADAGALFEEPYKHNLEIIYDEFNEFHKRVLSQESFESAQMIFIDEVLDFQDKFLKNDQEMKMAAFYGQVLIFKTIIYLITHDDAQQETMEVIPRSAKMIPEVLDMTTGNPQQDKRCLCCFKDKPF
ncbi:hypothetical protein Ciccas_006265 [Cichlidogyrus casuarinus]|uniref:Uncharacterized protein n=1 Tax=Cichlidogyrus casuarinus TaxID=1844966 RepID=A0ABD2Q679_9PLAT